MSVRDAKELLKRSAQSSVICSATALAEYRVFDVPLLLACRNQAIDCADRAHDLAEKAPHLWEFFCDIEDHFDRAAWNYTQAIKLFREGQACRRA